MTAEQRQPRFGTGHVIGGHYRLNDFIAFGSVSEVYAGVAIGSGQRVAIKILVEESNNHEVAWLERRIGYFLREAAVTGQLVHPNVVELVEVGHDIRAGHYIVLEYLPGDDLEQWVLREGVFSEEEARVIACQILSALSAAHRHKVIHRDLKPNNIQMMSRSGQPELVKIFDFGIAKIFHDDTALRTLTKGDTIVGTPMWMSPEQCRGHQLDERTDLYSVGAILQFLVTGEPPFEGGPVFKVLHAVLTEKPKPVGKVRRQLGYAPLSRTFERAVAKALHKNPKQRFIDADHFQAFLDRHTPSVAWPAITQRIAARMTDNYCPGLLIIQSDRPIVRDQGLKGLIQGALQNVDTYAATTIGHSNRSASVVFDTALAPSLTLLEAVAAALRLHVALKEEYHEADYRIQAGVGDPTLGLKENTAPLLDHLHSELARLEDWVGHEPTDGVFSPPEWLHELRREFKLVPVHHDVHSPLRVISQRPEAVHNPKVNHSSAERLVLDAICGQPMGLSLADLEGALFLSADAIEIFSAIADLQSSDRLRVDEDGRATRFNPVDDTLPYPELPPTELGMLHLRIFSLMAQNQKRPASKHLEEAQLAAVVNLEAAHHLSAVRRWIEMAKDAPIDEMRNCLNRALRLSALRTPHSTVKPTWQALENLPEITALDNDHPTPAPPLAILRMPELGKK